MRVRSLGGLWISLFYRDLRFGWRHGILWDGYKQGPATNRVGYKQGQTIMFVVIKLLPRRYHKHYGLTLLGWKTWALPAFEVVEALFAAGEVG